MLICVMCAYQERYMYIVYVYIDISIYIYIYIMYIFFEYIEVISEINVEDS